MRVRDSEERRRHHAEIGAVTLQTLMVQLDDRLMTVAEDFLREHTGQQIHRRAR